MTDWGQRFVAGNAKGTVLVLFVPSVDREESAIDEEFWETEALIVLGN